MGMAGVIFAQGEIIAKKYFGYQICHLLKRLHLFQMECQGGLVCNVGPLGGINRSPGLYTLLRTLPNSKLSTNEWGQNLTGVTDT